MNAADRVLAESHLRDLREALLKAIASDRSEAFLHVLRIRIADQEKELAAAP